MKSVLISIQPYWVFLIIAKIMGWKIDQEKTVEVRKTFPKDLDWNKKAIIYCSKNKQSFNLIPKKYQPSMEKFLGKVIGEFVCDSIYHYRYTKPFFYYGIKMYHTNEHCTEACLSWEELENYLGKKDGYAWHISDLVIYDKPKELGEFNKPWEEWIDKNGVWHDIRPCQCGKPCKHALFDDGENCEICGIDYDGENCPYIKITRPPQSWCYVEELGV